MKKLTREEFLLLVKKAQENCTAEEERCFFELQKNGFARYLYAVFTGGLNEQGVYILDYMDYEAEMALENLIAEYANCEMPDAEIAPEIYNYI